jgi:hypothetical protein
MWELRRHTTLWASTACNRDSFTFYLSTFTIISTTSRFADTGLYWRTFSIFMQKNQHWNLRKVYCFPHGYWHLKSRISWTLMRVAYVIFWTRFVSLIIMKVNSLSSCSQTFSCEEENWLGLRRMRVRPKLTNLKVCLSNSKNVSCIYHFSATRHSRQTEWDR